MTIKRAVPFVVRTFCIMYKMILVVVILAVQYVHVCELSGNDNNEMSVSSQNYSFDHVLANLTDNVVIDITTNNSTLSFHNKIADLKDVLISGLNNPTVYCYNTTMIIGGLQFDSCTNM